MEDWELRMQIVERLTADHEQALRGTNSEPGLLERMRNIEKSRLLFWLLVGNMAVVVGNTLLEFAFGK